MHTKLSVTGEPLLYRGPALSRLTEVAIAGLGGKMVACPSTASL
jgi:hypothetical protein